MEENYQAIHIPPQTMFGHMPQSNAPPVFHQDAQQHFSQNPMQHFQQRGPPPTQILSQGFPEMLGPPVGIEHCSNQRPLLSPPGVVYMNNATTQLPMPGLPPHLQTSLQQQVPMLPSPQMVPVPPEMMSPHYPPRFPPQVFNRGMHQRDPLNAISELEQNTRRRMTKIGETTGSFSSQEPSQQVNEQCVELNHNIGLQAQQDHQNSVQRNIVESDRVIDPNYPIRGVPPMVSSMRRLSSEELHRKMPPQQFLRPGPQLPQGVDFRPYPPTLASHQYPQGQFLPRTYDPFDQMEPRLPKPPPLKQGAPIPLSKDSSIECVLNNKEPDSQGYPSSEKTSVGVWPPSFLPDVVQTSCGANSSLKTTGKSTETFQSVNSEQASSHYTTSNSVDPRNENQEHVTEPEMSPENPTKMYAPPPSHQMDTSPTIIEKCVSDNNPNATNISDNESNQIDKECKLQCQEQRSEGSEPARNSSLENDEIICEHKGNPDKALDNNLTTVNKTDATASDGLTPNDASVPTTDITDDIQMDETIPAKNRIEKPSINVNGITDLTIDDKDNKSNKEHDSVENDNETGQSPNRSELNNEKQCASISKEDVSERKSNGRTNENDATYLKMKVDGKLARSKYYECTPCTYKTPSKRKYDEHMEAHIHRKYVCKVCDKVFIKSSDVQRHEPLHSQNHKSPFRRFHNHHKTTENMDTEHSDPNAMPNMALTQTFTKSVPDRMPISDPHMDTDGSTDTCDEVNENGDVSNSDVNSEIELMRKQYLDSVKRPGDIDEEEMEIEENGESIDTSHSQRRIGGLWPAHDEIFTPSSDRLEKQHMLSRRRADLNSEDPTYKPSCSRNQNFDEADGVRRSGRIRTVSTPNDSSVWANLDDPSLKLEVKAEPQDHFNPDDNAFQEEPLDYHTGLDNDWMGRSRRPYMGAWKYNCVRCKYKTNQKVRYNMHMQSHNGNYICPVCDKAMLYLSDFVRHVDTHNSYFYRCPSFDACKYSSSSLNSYEKHLRTIHPEHASECPQCGYKSNSTVRFFKHLESHNLTAQEMLQVLCNDTVHEGKNEPPLDIPDDPSSTAESVSLTAVSSVPTRASSVLTTVSPVLPTASDVSPIASGVSPKSVMLTTASGPRDLEQVPQDINASSDFSPKIVSVTGSLTPDASKDLSMNESLVKHVPFNSPKTPGHGDASKQCMFVCMYCKHMFTTQQAIRSHIEKEHNTKLVIAPGNSPAQSSFVNKPRDPSGQFSVMRNLFNAPKTTLPEKTSILTKQVKTSTGQLIQVPIDENGVVKSSVAYKCLLCTMLLTSKLDLDIHLDECKKKHGYKQDIQTKGQIFSFGLPGNNPQFNLIMPESSLYKEVHIVPKLVKKIKEKQEPMTVEIDGATLPDDFVGLETITRNKCLKSAIYKCRYLGSNKVELFANRDKIEMLKGHPEPKHNVIYKINVGGIATESSANCVNTDRSPVKLRSEGKEANKVSEPKTDESVSKDDPTKIKSTDDLYRSLDVTDEHKDMKRMSVSVDNQLPKDPTEDKTNNPLAKNENLITKGELDAIQKYEDTEQKETESQIDEDITESNKDDQLLTILGLVHKDKAKDQHTINENLPSTSTIKPISSAESDLKGDIMVPSADAIMTSSSSVAKSPKLKVLSTDIPCRMCSFKTRSPECYEAHVLGHKAVKHELTDAIFQSYSLVNVGNRELYECKLCPYRSKRLDKIEQHLFFHKTKQFMCNICDRAFIKRCDLERHMEVEMRNRMRGQGYVFNGPKKTVQLVKRRSGYKRGKYRKHRSSTGNVKHQTVKNETLTGYQPNNIPDHLMDI